MKKSFKIQRDDRHINFFTIMTKPKMKLSTKIYKKLLSQKTKEREIYVEIHSEER